MSHAPQIDPKAAVSCVDCLNALFHCFGARQADASVGIQHSPATYMHVATITAGPAHQFDRYYKDGRIDECQKRLDELKFCMKLKLAGPEEAKVRNFRRRAPNAQHL